jgi:hypothetical protein
MTDTSNPSSLLLPVGPIAIGAGWSTVMTYPSLQTNWVLWQSPNNQYWGSSSRLQATLETNGANTYFIPERLMDQRRIPTGLQMVDRRRKSTTITDESRRNRPTN